MKRLFTLILLPLLLLTSCGEKPTHIINDAFKIDFKNSEIKKNSDGDYILDFYSISDFHGATDFKQDENIGITRLASMYSNYRLDNPGGTFFLSSGDMWQGSADSNITEGYLINEIMNYMGFEAMALGNHEFDWGIETLIKNKEEAKFPYLANNIVDVTTNTNVDFVLPHYLIDRGDIQIGVIGSIGEGITDQILQSNVVNLEFKNPAPYVKESSDILKSLGADIICYLTHDDVSSINDELSPYIDVAFGGHSHNTKMRMVDNVPVLQTTNNGGDIAHVQFAINTNKKEVTLKEIIKPDYNILPHKDIEDLYNDIYEKDIKHIKEEVVGEVDRNITKTEIISKLCEYLFNKYNDDNSILFACHNEARATFSKGPITYGDIYKALPFDNYFEILEIKGSMLSPYMNNIIYPDSFSIYYEPQETYKIVTINYLSESIGGFTSKESINMFARDIYKEMFLQDPDNNPFN